jgi:hypothetical protein
MTMSRLFLMVFVVGMLAIVPAAIADVPTCDCLDDWDATWPVAGENCLFVCPGAWGSAGHNTSSLANNKICLYQDDLCSVPLVGFDALRIDLSQVLPDSICVCDGQCTDFPYIFPQGPTDANGCTTFRFRGSILQLELAGGDDVAWLQVSGCHDRPVRFRSPDMDADCDVDLSDLILFGKAFVSCPPYPSGGEAWVYAVYAGHCAPCPKAGGADFVVFAPHFGHTCTHTVCDP